MQNAFVDMKQAASDSIYKFSEIEVAFRKFRRHFLTMEQQI